MRSIIAAAVRWPILVGIYLALAGQLSLSEIAAGLIAGALATAVSLVLRDASERPLRLSAPWPRLILRASWSLLHDAGIVVARLAKAIVAVQGGTTVGQDLVAPSDGAAGAGRRGLVVLFASLAPNGFVIEDGKTGLRLHRLVAAPPSEDRLWPT